MRDRNLYSGVIFEFFFSSIKNWIFKKKTFSEKKNIKKPTVQNSITIWKKKKKKSQENDNDDGARMIIRSDFCLLLLIWSSYSSGQDLNEWYQKMPENGPFNMRKKAQGNKLESRKIIIKFSCSFLCHWLWLLLLHIFHSMINLVIIYFFSGSPCVKSIIHHHWW